MEMLPESSDNDPKIRVWAYSSVIALLPCVRS